MHDEEPREPFADARAEVAAETTPMPAGETADADKVPTEDDQRAYPDGSADVLLCVVDDEDDEDGPDDDEDDEDDEDEPPAPVLIRVPPVKKWPDEAMDCLREHRYTRWAELVLSRKNLTKWRNFAPEVGEANDFLNRWSDLVGQTAGKSRRYRRSLKAARAR